MCGITGFISFELNNIIFKESINNMANKLINRGPDDQGIWCDPNLGIAMAHRRLSIVDVSTAGHQPIFSGCERFCMTFNGEIYNHHDLRLALPESINWRGHSDSETLINAISFWGLKKTLKEIVGMFAFVIWDRYKKKLIMVRDRLGEKPLYYGYVGKNLVFASELKAIEVFPNFKKRINRKSLEMYLKFGYIPAPYSIYENIYKLLPGNFIEFSLEDINSKNTPKSSKYWSFESIAEVQQSNTYLSSDNESIDYLENLLKNTISGQLLGDVPIGAFLSGGIDSSSVVGIMQNQSSNPVNTFTVGFDEFGYDESKIAKEISSYFGTNHKDFILSPNDALDIIPKLHDIYDEPFSDVSQIPTFFLSKFASEHVKVCLSGDGGDESFCGYYRHIAGPKIWRTLRYIPFPLRRIIVKFIQIFPISSWDSFYYYCETFLPKYLRINSPGLKLQKLSELINTNSLFELYLSLISSWQSPENIILNSNSIETNYPFKNLKLNDYHHELMYMDSINYLPNDILVKLDRAAMASSLETRLPFLDHRLIEFSWRIPLGMKLRNKKSKWLLRQVLKRYLPENLIDRPKAGFSVPIAGWLRGPLKSWAENLMDDKLIESQGYFSVIPIKKKWQEHLSGKQDWSQQLWTILIFQSWLQRK